MTVIPFGKTQGLTSKPAETLAECVEPALNMVRFAFVFVDLAVAFVVKHVAVSRPLVAE